MRGILSTIARVANRHDPRPPGFRERPERVVLDVRDGVVRSSKPPVRIFVGTEPGQYRAERVFQAGIVRPPRALTQLHELRIAVGGAHYFGTAFDAGPHCRLCDVDAVTRRVRLLLGFAGPLETARAVRPQVAI